MTLNGVMALIFALFHQIRSQRGTRVHVPRHRRSIFGVLWGFHILPLDPAGVFRPQTPWFVPLSKFLATPLTLSVQ